MPSLFKKQVDKSTEDISSLWTYCYHASKIYVILDLFVYIYMCLRDIWSHGKNTLIFIFAFCYHTLIIHIVKTSVFHNILSSKYILHFNCIQLPHCLPSLIPLQRLLLPISPFSIFDLFICIFTTLWVSLDVFIREPEGICYRIRLSPLAMFNPTETLREW